MCQERGKYIGNIDNLYPRWHYTIVSAAEYHMGLHLDQVDATNLGSIASNSMLTNFEDVPALNPVAALDTETTYNTFYFL